MIVKVTLPTVIARIPKIEKYTRDESCGYTPEEFYSKEEERLFPSVPGQQVDKLKD